MSSLPVVPSHYDIHPRPIDVIESWNLNFSLGNVIKYVARAEKKGDHIGDLKKALWFLHREILRIEPLGELGEIVIDCPKG